MSILVLRTPFVRACAVMATCTFLVQSCTGVPESEPSTNITVFEGARVIVGDGSEPIEGAVIVVEDGRVTAVGPLASTDYPAGVTHVDLSGKTVIPALVNSHVHLSVEREARTEQLQHMAYYGAGAVVSLGHDSGMVPFDMREEEVPNGARSFTAGRGITSPEPGRNDVPYWVTSVEEARAAVRELADRRVDIIKIWVDDRGGQYEKLSPELYAAVIEEAHANDIRVTAHVFSLDDAKGLLRAGVDAFAHGVRDRDVDDELITLWQERPNVYLVPNLPNPGVAVDLSWITTVPNDELTEMQEAASAGSPEAQARFGIQARNLARLNDAGVRIAFGTDGSVPWAVHLEMEDMVRSGMTPAEVIAAATGTSAELLRNADIGLLASGRSADFVVLDANPLDDIANTRRINAVYLRGSAIERDEIARMFREGDAGEGTP